MNEFLDFLFWWAVLSAMYCALLFTADWVICEWRERQRRRQALQKRLARIDTEMATSMRRLSTAFLIAQREMRQTSAREDTGHRPPC